MMKFSSGVQGVFVELGTQSILLARTSAASGPMTVAELRECAADDPAALAEAIAAIQPKKSPSGYLHATVGVSPEKRLVRRQTLELKRLKEAGYIEEVCVQQLRIELDKYTVAVLNSDAGTHFDAAKGTQKEVLFCGLPNEDIDVLQADLLERRIYPERIELTPVARLGALVDYLAFTKSKTPTLVLEIGPDSTHSFIVTAGGVEASRPIPNGLAAMVPVVQKELGLKDEESAKKLFYSNTFDFTGMGPLLTKRLLKELQSSIGFYEVQTGQSVGQLVTTQLPPKLQWLETALASALGIPTLKMDPGAWLTSRQITVAESLHSQVQDPRWFGLFALMARYDASHAVTAEEKK
jgi:hypothetical protein